MSPPWGYFHAGSSNLLSEFIHHHVLMLHMMVSDCWMGRWELRRPKLGSGIDNRRGDAASIHQEAGGSSTLP